MWIEPLTSLDRDVVGIEQGPGMVSAIQLEQS
jgi:hypothetical protein